MPTSDHKNPLCLEFLSRLTVKCDEEEEGALRGDEAPLHSEVMSKSTSDSPFLVTRGDCVAKEEHVSFEELLRRDFRSPLARYIEESRRANDSCGLTLEVPQNSLGHIIGKCHRTINALREYPGVSRVMPIRSIVDEDIQLLHISGTEEGVAKVSAQIKRLQLRSLAGSRTPDMHVTCFRSGLVVSSHADDPILLRMVSSEQVAFFGANHLRSFSDQHFSDDMDDKMFVYYYFHSRSSGEAAAMSTIFPYLLPTDLPKLTKRQKMLERLRSSQLHGSWDEFASQNRLKDFVKKVSLTCEIAGHHMKAALDIGKTFFRGLCSSLGPLWKVSVQRLDNCILEQSIGPLFRGYCSSASIIKAMQFLTSAGYKQMNSRHTISSRLVDKESDLRTSFRLKISEHHRGPSGSNGRGVSKLEDHDIMVEFYQAPHRDVTFSFLSDSKGLDLQLTLKSCSCREVPAISQSVMEGFYENWVTRCGQEDPVTHPVTGKVYYPISVLRKESCFYIKEDLVVSLTEVSAMSDELKLNSRWKVSMHNVRFGSCCETMPSASSDECVDSVVSAMNLLVTEASKLAEIMADE